MQLITLAIKLYSARLHLIHWLFKTNKSRFKVVSSPILLEMNFWKSLPHAFSIFMCKDGDDGDAAGDESSLEAFLRRATSSFCRWGALKA